MALYRYLKQQSEDDLPDPRGPLSRKVPSASIASANEEVRCVILDPEPVKGARGSYTKFTAEQKAGIRKRAAEHGVAATIRYFRKQFPDLKESSVRT